MFSSIAPNASKISRGSAVYGISATENADTSGISADAATRTSLRSSLARFSSDYDSSSFSGIYQLKTELSAKLLAAAAENGDSSLQTIFYADQDGVVVYGSDGYESYTEDSLTPELFSTKASVVSFDSGAQTEPGNAVYRLVTDEQWEIAVPVTNKQVVTLSNFSTIKVKFLKDGKTQTGTLNLKSINDQNYAVISFTSGMIRYAEDRFLSIELVTNTGSGLKIPNTAITEKDFYKIPAQMLVQGGDSNSSGFLREKTDKKGNVMLDDNGQPVTEFVNATIYEQVNDENDNPVEYYVDMAAFERWRYTSCTGFCHNVSDWRNGSAAGCLLHQQRICCIPQNSDHRSECGVFYHKKTKRNTAFRSMIILWKMHPPSVKKILCIKYWRLERYAEREL